MKFGVTRVNMREGADGVRYMSADQKLQDYATRMTDRLVHWAKTKPGVSVVKMWRSFSKSWLMVE